MRVLAMFALGVTLALAAPIGEAGEVGGLLTPKTETPRAARALSRAFAEVARAIAPSVVRIEVTASGEEATASGIVLDTRGNVVTSSHVLDGVRSAGIEIVLVDGRRLAGEVVGRDAQSDVALVKMVDSTRRSLRRAIR